MIFIENILILLHIKQAIILYKSFQNQFYIFGQNHKNRAN